MLNRAVLLLFEKGGVVQQRPPFSKGQVIRQFNDQRYAQSVQQREGFLWKSRFYDWKTSQKSILTAL